jgi:hypothetical protein
MSAVQRFVLRDYLAAACLISAHTILCIAKGYCNLMPLRRDQKLFPHLGEAGTAVFAVQEVEQGGHDLTSLFELHHHSPAYHLSWRPRCELDHNLSLFSTEDPSGWD